MATKVLEIAEQNTLRRHWDTFQSFTEEVSRPVRLCPLGGLESSRLDNAEWSGTKSFEEAMQFARNGWPEGFARMERLRNRLKHLEPEMSERHVSSFAESGDDVDIDRFVVGEPECMLEYQVVDVPVAGRVVRLMCSASASSGISAESMFLRGAAAVMLADLIDQSGLRSEIVVCSAGEPSGGGDTGHFYTITVKRPDQPVELDRLAFMLASPSVFRRLLFRAYEQLSDEDFTRYIGSRYTRPMNPPPQGDGVIMIDTMQYGFGDQLNTDAECVAFVNKMIERFTEPQPTTA